MKIFLDCLPCMLRQVLEASYMSTDNEEIHNQIMQEAIAVLSQYKDFVCAPQIAEVLHNIVKRRTGKKDPYAEIKLKDVIAALRLEPIARRLVAESSDLLTNALKASATGNIMDSALYNDLDIDTCFLKEFRKPFVICDKDRFVEDMASAKMILFIGDNAGEVVFDKVLIDYLSRKFEVIYAVRGCAIINDATITDTLKTGISDYAKIISSGCGMPGTMLEACNEEFKAIFNKADIIISKGQGNFEALSDTTHKGIYYLLKAKCKRVARLLGVAVNEYVFEKR